MGVADRLAGHLARLDIGNRIGALMRVWDQGRGSGDADARDATTGLLCAKPFMSRLKGQWPDHGVLLLVTADAFAEISAEQGADAGDALLSAIAGRIRENTRDTDIIGRLGQNLFAVYLVRAERIHALRIATRLARTVPTPARPDLAVTLAIGGAEAETATSPTHLLEQAQAAMAHASSEHPRFFPRLATRDGSPAAETA